MIAVALVVFAAAAARAEREVDGWIKVVSPNFEMYSRVRESDSRRLLRELETFRHVVSRFLGLTNVQRRPAKVFYFDRESEFRPYKPLYNGRPRPVSGFHVEDPLDYGLALERQGIDSATMRLLFHEYTHLLTSRQFRHAPIWVNEGVAEVFSTFESRGGDQFDIGVAVTNHVFYLHQHPPARVAHLLSVNIQSPDYNEQTRAGTFYATSWLLAHHLLFARRGFQDNVMARYAAACSSTTNQLEAFRTAFGKTPSEMDVSLREYMHRGSYTIVRQTYPELPEAAAERVEITRAELDYAMGRLLQLVQRSDAARERLERAAAAAPMDPRPREALAILAWREQRRDAMREAVDRAVALGSREAFIHFLAAEARYEDLTLRRPPPSVAVEMLREGRSLCERAIALDPDLPHAHHLLGVYVFAGNPRAPGLAATHVREALRCDPDYKPAVLTLASLLAAQGDIPEAQRLLARMLAGPMSPELRNTANRVAAEIAKRAAGSADAKSPGTQPAGKAN